MSNYVKTTNFAAKDALPSGNPAKIAKGTEVDSEFNAIATAIATKEDTANKGVANGYVGIDASGNVAVSGSLSAASIIPTGASVPVNGMFLSAGNTVAFASNTTTRASVNGTGNWVFASPSSGTTAALTTIGTALSAAPSSESVNSFLTLTNAAGSRRLEIGYLGTSSSNAYGFGLGGVGLNGLNGLTFATNDSARMSVNSTGNVTINTPSSGIGLTVNGTAPALFTDGTTTFRINTSGGVGELGTFTNHSLGIVANSATRMTIGTAGNVTINAPSSGTSLAVNGLTAATTFLVNSTGANGAFVTGYNVGLDASAWNLYCVGADPLTIGTVGNTAVRFRTNSTLRVNIGTDHSTSLQATDDAGTFQTVGWRDAPVNIQNTTYTFALSDRGKTVYANSGATTYTIPANASVAFPVGTVIILVNGSGSNMTLQITTDTLNWFQGGANTTGTRTIANASVVTLLKIASTQWIVSGAGIS